MCQGPLAESTPGVFCDSPLLVGEKIKVTTRLKKDRIHGRMRDLNQALFDCSSRASPTLTEPLSSLLEMSRLRGRTYQGASRHIANIQKRDSRVGSDSQEQQPPSLAEKMRATMVNSQEYEGKLHLASYSSTDSEDKPLVSSDQRHFLFNIKKIYLLIWLQWVSGVACSIFGCSRHTDFLVVA